MKTKLILILSLLALVAFNQPSNYFTGKIVYKHEIKDASGKDITNMFAQVIGKEQHYFINAGNYKAYDEKGNLLQVYNSASNTYHQIGKDRSVQKIDASTANSKVFTVKDLSTTEKIAGYTCSAVEIITDDATTTYYYTPSIKVDPAVYKNHNFGEWNKILQATKGALPLKFSMIMNKQGFIVWTSTATSVQKETLKDSEFDVPH